MQTWIREGAGFKFVKGEIGMTAMCSYTNSMYVVSLMLGVQTDIFNIKPEHH